MADPVRRQVDEQIQRARLRPVASPTDIYARPAAVDTTRAMGLARALEQVSPRLRQYFNEEADQRSREDFERGRTESIKSALSWKEAVEQGKVPANESPWFMRGYKEQSGRVLGQREDARWRIEYSQWDGKDLDDPKAFEQWIAAKNKTVLEGVDDPDVRLGLQTELRVTNQNLRAHHVEYNAKRIYEKNAEDAGVLIQGDIDKAILVKGGRISAEDVRDIIGKVGERARFLGVKGEDVNTIVTNAVINAARKHGSTDMLKGLMLDRPDGTPGPGRTVKGSALIRSAEDAIISRAAANEQRAAAAEARAERRMTKQVYSDAVKWKLANPDKEFPTEMLMRIAPLDPAVAFSLQNHNDTERRRRAQEARTQTDPFYFNRVYDDLIAGKDPKTVLDDAAARRDMIGGATISDQMLIHLREAFERGRGADVLRNDFIQKSLQDWTNVNKTDFEVRFGIKIDSVSPEMLNKGKMSIMQEMTRWATSPEGLRAGPLDVQRKYMEVQQQVLETIRVSQKAAQTPPQSGSRAPSDTRPTTTAPQPSGSAPSTPQPQQSGSSGPAPAPAAPSGAQVPNGIRMAYERAKIAADKGDEKARALVERWETQYPTLKK